MTAIELYNLATEAQYLRGDVLATAAGIEVLIKHCGAEIIPSLISADRGVEILDALIAQIHDSYPLDINALFDGEATLPADAQAEIDRLTAARDVAIDARRAAYAPVRAKADEIDPGADISLA